LRAYTRQRFVSVEAMDRYVEGWKLQVAIGWPSEQTRIAAEAARLG